MNTRTSTTIDKFLLFCVSGVLAIAIAGYFSRDTWLIALVSITSAFSITALVSFYKEKKNTKIKNKKVDLALMQFYFKDKQFAYDTIFNALSTRYKCRNDVEFIIVNETIAVYPYLVPKTLSFEKFCEILGNLPNDYKRLVIVTTKGKGSSFSKEMALLDLSIDVKVLSSEKTYNLLKQLDGLPKNEHNLKPNRRTAREFLVAALSPKAARRYLFTALLLIGSSFFMPISIYFMIVGGLCLLLAVLSKLNIIERIKQKN
ncbi:MAG: hypothetical protein FWE13_00455 [Firmicutes bacterium]|nr:hypothetical protein [Bacillota bacterium]